MASDNNVVGKLSVEIDANPKAAVSGLKTVETAAKQTTTTLNATGAAGRKVGDDIAAGSAVAGKSADGLVTTFGRLREVMSKVFAPAAILATLSAMVTKFADATQATERFQKSLDDVVLAFRKMGRSSAESGLSDIERQLKAIEHAAADAKDNITAQLESKMHELSTPQGALWNWLTGGDSIDGIADRASKAADQISKAQTGDSDRARKRKREEDARTEAEAVKQWWINAEKELQEYREKADKDRLDAIKERQAAEEKAAAAAKRNADDIAKAYGAIESALNSIVKSQQSFANQGQSPVAVGRIAAALEDIARSPRGGAILRGRID